MNFSEFFKILTWRVSNRPGEFWLYGRGPCHMVQEKNSLKFINKRNCNKNPLNVKIMNAVVTKRDMAIVRQF